jgi:hypothetical protein
VSGAPDGAVHSRAGHAEEFLEFADGVLAGAVELDEVGFLHRAELGLLAAQPSLGVGDAHALARARAHEVGFELGDHDQHVEQQPAHRIGRIVHGGAERELDLAGGELVGDGARVGQRARQSVELGDEKRVAGAARRERLT